MSQTTTPRLSPFQTALPATHTGRNVRTGRRTPLVQLDGVYLTRTEAKARLSGFTREEDRYVDILPIRLH
jgi:hypothetical protein